MGKGRTAKGGMLRFLSYALALTILAVPLTVFWQGMVDPPLQHVGMIVAAAFIAAVLALLLFHRLLPAGAQAATFLVCLLAAGASSWVTYRETDRHAARLEHEKQAAQLEQKAAREFFMVFAGRKGTHDDELIDFAAGPVDRLDEPERRAWVWLKLAGAYAKINEATMQFTTDSAAQLSAAPMSPVMVVEPAKNAELHEAVKKENAAFEDMHLLLQKTWNDMQGIIDQAGLDAKDRAFFHSEVELGLGKIVPMSAEAAKQIQIRNSARVDYLDFLIQNRQSYQIAGYGRDQTLAFTNTAKLKQFQRLQEAIRQHNEEFGLFANQAKAQEDKGRRALLATAEDILH